MFHVRQRNVQFEMFMVRDVAHFSAILCEGSSTAIDFVSLNELDGNATQIRQVFHLTAQYDVLPPAISFSHSVSLCAEFSFTHSLHAVR